MLLSITAGLNLTAYAEISGSYEYKILNDGTAKITKYRGYYDTNVTIPSTIDGYTVTSIGDCAFYECESLTSVTIPDSVTSIGNYAFDECFDLADVYYTGSEDEWQNISIEDGNGCLTRANVHYNSIPKCSVHSYDNGMVTTEPTCTTAGEKVYTCEKCGDSYKEAVPANGHKSVSANNAVKATCEKSGKTADTKCSVCGKVIKKGTTIPATGHKVVTDKAVKATYAKAGKTEGSHCKTCGKVIVAQKTVAKLTVPKITLSSVKSKKSKQITVAWKKNTNVTGYQIQYSTSSKFTNAKTVTVSKNSTTSTTIKKLTGKKKYYVRIRAYKTENGKKYYSAWSASKSVTTKK